MHTTLYLPIVSRSLAHMMRASQITTKLHNTVYVCIDSERRDGH